MPRTLHRSLPTNANFLPKPFTTLQLVAAVDGALERPAA
jgi:hypothetical protein